MAVTRSGGWTGVCRNFRRILPICNYLFCDFSQSDSCLRTINGKMSPFLGNFRRKTHPYWKQIPVPLTCYIRPPPQELAHRVSWQGRPLKYFYLYFSHSFNLQPAALHCLQVASPTYIHG